MKTQSKKTNKKFLTCKKKRDITETKPRHSCGRSKKEKTQCYKTNSYRGTNAASAVCSKRQQFDVSSLLNTNKRTRQA